MLYWHISAFRSRFMISMTTRTIFEKLHNLCIYARMLSGASSRYLYCKYKQRLLSNYCQERFFPFSFDQIPFLWAKSYRREQCCIRKSTNSQIPQCLCTSLHIWLINRLISNFLSSLWRGTIGTWEEIRWEAKWLL